MTTQKWPLTPSEIEDHADNDCPKCDGSGLARCVSSECYDFDCPGEFICLCVRGEKPEGGSQ